MRSTHFGMVSFTSVMMLLAAAGFGGSAGCGAGDGDADAPDWTDVRDASMSDAADGVDSSDTGDTGVDDDATDRGDATVIPADIQCTSAYGPVPYAPTEEYLDACLQNVCDAQDSYTFMPEYQFTVRSVEWAADAATLPCSVPAAADLLVVRAEWTDAFADDGQGVDGTPHPCGGHCHPTVGKVYLVNTATNGVLYLGDEDPSGWPAGVELTAETKGRRLDVSGVKRYFFNPTSALPVYGKSGAVGQFPWAICPMLVAEDGAIDMCIHFPLDQNPGGCPQDYEYVRDGARCGDWPASDVSWTACDAEQSTCPAGERCVFGYCLKKLNNSAFTAVVDGCARSLPQADCTTAGGIWQCSPAACEENGIPVCECSCPTTDFDWPCWADNHCQGFCEFPDEGSGPACEEIGACSHYLVKPYWGCQCTFDDSGENVPEFECVC